MNWLNAVIQGVFLGGFYALFACGLSLMFGVMRIINLAHGDLAITGAFAVWLVATHLHLSPFIALLPVLPGMLLLGLCSPPNPARSQSPVWSAHAVADDFWFVDCNSERATANLFARCAFTRLVCQSGLDRELANQFSTIGAIFRPARSCGRYPSSWRAAVRFATHGVRVGNASNRSGCRYRGACWDPGLIGLRASHGDRGRDCGSGRSVPGDSLDL